MTEKELIKTIELTVGNFIQRIDIPHEFVMKPEFSVAVKHWIAGFELRLKQDYLENKIEQLSCAYPTTWWDAVKERFLPKWSRKWLPVNHTKILLMSKNVYPTIPFQGREHVSFPVLLKQERKYTDDGSEE